MKEFLFSRSHKKHYSSAVVRMGKNNLGFSLVELVIVIAIMAILVAVAIPVFGVFIQKAEKSNDQNVVKDIVYAIELANKSGAFMEEDTMSFGNVKYPVGFVVISEDGTQVITSTTTVTPEEPCQFATVKYSDAIFKENVTTCSKNSKTATVYECKDDLEFVYCTIHSDVTVIKTLTEAQDTGKAKAYSSCTKTNWHLNCDSAISETLKIPAGQTIITDTGKLYGVSSNPNYCTANFKNSMGTIQPGTIEANTNNAIYTALEDTFGADFENNLKLTSDQWSGESVAYSTLYSYAPTMFEEVGEIADLLVDLQALKDFGLAGYFTDDYEDSADLMASFTTYLIENVEPDQWDAAWKKAAGQSTEYGFDLPNCKNDYLWAARMSYNSAFASYCQTNGIAAKYVDVIAKYGENAYEEVSAKVESTLGGGGLGAIGGALAQGTLELLASEHSDKNIPSVVNTAAFTDSNGLLKSQFGNTEADLAAFEKCAELFEEYKNSEVCVENGRSVYQTMEGVADTSDVAQATGDYFGYYNTYLTEMSELYEVAQSYAGTTGVIIIVCVENGIATCQISPAAADFRNQ